MANRLEHSINDGSVNIGLDPLNHPGIPVSADEFERGVDIILEAQQEFLSAMVPPPSPSKLKVWELQEDDARIAGRTISTHLCAKQ